jgi:acyl-coenzyme A synthetase/AMP-(fatty) acid ligase
VLDTAGTLGPAHRSALAGVGLLISAGAPIPSALLHSAADLMPNARLHTPYGMTEALPVTDIDLPGIDAAAADAISGAVAGAGNGVCVGRPVPGATVRIAALDALGFPAQQTDAGPGVTGEITVRAPHVKDGYDRLWLTQRTSDSNPGWHRTGDVGHLDAAGRLWVEGRLAHVLTTADGVLTPVAAEHLAETLDAVSRAAVVGVGPAGAQVPVAVVETVPAARRPAPAGADLAAAVRAAIGPSGTVPAAVLTVPRIPTDIRHNAKVDRSALAAWATTVLAGGRMTRP